MRVLIVDDDTAVRDSLRRALRFEGYEVSEAGDGDEVPTAVATHRPDVVLLDVQMPHVDGLEACRRLRSAGERVPVLMLTARDTTGDRVTGLDVGADDYLVKPFALEELLARLRALLRRTATAAPTPAVLVFGDLRLDPGTREVSRAGHAVALTRTEHALLELFLRAPRRVLARDHILREVWGYEHDPGSNVLDVAVSGLRRKLEAGGGDRLLHTVRGVGFVLRTDPPPT